MPQKEKYTETEIQDALIKADGFLTPMVSKYVEWYGGCSFSRISA
jgi:hypothetical protein